VCVYGGTEGDAGRQDRARGADGIESARQLAVSWNRRTAAATAAGGGPSLNVDKAAGGPEPRVDRLLFDLD
jgi:hypothetical protein